MWYFLLFGLIFVHSYEFMWNNTLVDHKITYRMQHTIKRCKKGSFKSFYLYPYDGTLNGALQNCGQSCVDTREYEPCNGVIIVNSYLCQTVRCLDPVFKKRSRKNKTARQMMFISFL